ncbi:MAG: hypothetical protein Q8M86_03540 [Syntrophales bacterium]|nr:hypothetical protein [Syntrophales bacterium]MDP3096997.1 hypothetical protein [Syntrophales bacterium]
MAAATNGIAAQDTWLRGSPEMPQLTKRQIPTGGVSIPMARLTTMSTPPAKSLAMDTLVRKPKITIGMDGGMMTPIAAGAADREGFRRFFAAGEHLF